MAVAVAAGSSGGWLWLVAAGAGYGWWRHQGRTTNAMLKRWMKWKVRARLLFYESNSSG